MYVICYDAMPNFEKQDDAHIIAWARYEFDRKYGFCNISEWYAEIDDSAWVVTFRKI